MSPLSVLCAVGLIGASAAAAAPADDPLAGSRWTSRVLLVAAESATDPALERQRRLYHDLRAGARERDLVMVEAVETSPKAEVLRRRFDIGAGFTALLIGKDGGEKLRSDRPIDLTEVFSLIDTMPMRQEEMRKGLE